MKWQVWSEGYDATGEHADAELLGEFEADSFLGAAQQWVDADPERAKCFRVGADGVPTYWGCRLFDNEAEARASFG